MESDGQYCIRASRRVRSCAQEVLRDTLGAG